MLISREQLPAGAQYVIRSYGDDHVTVNEHSLRQSFFLSPATLHTDWPPATSDELTTAHLDSLLALEPEVVLLGTGPVLNHPGVELLGHVMQQNVGIEVMDTPAACRSYNILLNEDRRVVVGFLLG
ncbi:MAG TPA: Mth938-like domain-containing protein [Gammaproteobacteria bacterium]|nr:Mth938-like domain-containing protein [Gammaproteobacteria bacterium]